MANVNETLQKAADCNRLLNIGLWNHDSVTVEAAFEKVSAMVGPEMAEKFILERITSLMSQGWGFVDENTGEASPLI